MKSHLLAWSFALFAPLAAGCGGDEPPPMTPADLPPQPPPPQPQVGGDAPQDGQYASGEVAVGDDGNADAYQDNDPSALQDFHPALDGSGTWQDDPTYGTVWVPSPQVVGADFVPYQTAGHWVMGDDDQYVWVSDYDWGWAPFHYGRWVPLDGGGWAWIPGRVYRGAWVNWGADDGYTVVGWYPMGPEFIWRGGVAIGYTYTVGPRWAYCGRADVFAPNIGARVIVGAGAAGFAGRVRPIAVSGGARFSSGPSPSRLGYSPSQIPHASGVGAAGIAKAASFSKPSTAVSAGGHPPTRTGTPTAGTFQAHGAATGGATGGATTMPSRGNMPTTTSSAPGEHGATAGTPATSRSNIPSQTHTGTATTGGTTYPTGRTTGATPTAQPQQQPKKKPAPQDAPAPRKSGGGRPSGGHHR